MTADSATGKLELEGLGRRRVEADFSGGQVSSDGGGVLLRDVDRRLRLTERLAACFSDHRRRDLVEHTVQDLVAQRLYGLALGYEDLNDHDRLSRDPLLAVMVGKTDPEGEGRRMPKDRGLPLASASTLGRIERTKDDAGPATRYEKIRCDFDAIRDAFVDVFVESFTAAPLRLVLDLDPSDIPLHGDQQQRFFHGFYGHYCYLPMYLYCGAHPLAMKLRPANIDGAAGAVDIVRPVIERLRAAWPHLHVVLRGDSGFCREDLMSWCEQNRVDFVFGMARNSRLEAAIAQQMEQARREHLRTGSSARQFRSFTYRTRQSWSRARRVIGKAEYLAKGANPRFVVTSLSAVHYEKRYLYEDIYCARGEMENRIKEQQLDLYGDRASCHQFRGNEIRVWMSMAAQVLVVGLRRLALAGTELAQAQAGTLRTKLLKVGALVSVSVRRVYVQLSSAFPLQELFIEAQRRLRHPRTASG